MFTSKLQPCFRRARSPYGLSSARRSSRGLNRPSVIRGETRGARRGSVIVAGSRIRSSSSSDRSVLTAATSRTVRPVACASFAMAAARSYPTWGTSVVTIARPWWTMSAPRLVAFRPLTHWSARLRDADARMSIDSSRLWAATGIMTFISKLPDWPATVIAASFPMTCAATWQTDSGITGLTLPGMIELPGCTSGSSISPSPARGPEPSHRMSLAIFIRLTATVLRAPLHSTTPSSEDWAWKWLSVSVTVAPSMSDSLAQTAAANSGWLFTPVPTAVPPSATSDSPVEASSAA